MEPIPIRNPFPGALCLLVESTASTQAEARVLAGNRHLPGQAFPPGSLVAAQRQSAGRGRFPERTWESETGKNLLFTIFLEAETASLPGLPIRIGSALCEAVESLPLSPRLKWPNDLMLGDRKAAGILCEAGPSGVFAGIGLNCNQLAFPGELAARATSLAAELGRELDRWALLGRFLEALAASLGDALWREKAEARLWKMGESLVFLEGRGSLVARIEGIDTEGSLLLREKGSATVRPHAAGELTTDLPPYRV